MPYEGMSVAVINTNIELNAVALVSASFLSIPVALYQIVSSHFVDISLSRAIAKAGSVCPMKIP
jgi:hypothetical protein